MYHQDWLMRQIEIIAETLARVVFRKAPARRAEIVLQQKSGAPGAELTETLLAMVRAGELCTAEDLLYERLDPNDRDGLAAALCFYSALNALPDAELEARNFPRDEILSGLTDVCRRYGLEDVLRALPGGEDGPVPDA